VNVNGSHILNDKMAYFWMNCAGPEGPGNTVGMLTYSGFMGQAAVSPSGETSGGDPSVSAETPGEAGFLGGQGFAEGGCMGPLPGMGDSPLGGGFLDGLMSPEGIVGLAQQAHGLATTDWSNPGAALGAIGGVAGMAGLGSVAQAAGLAQQGLALATTDWSNPGSALGTVMNLAGMSGLGGSLLPNPSGPNPAPSVPINDGCWGTGGGSSSDLPPGIKIDGCF
jgi:DNA-binding phage protein